MKNLPDKIYLNFGEITKEEFEESDYKEFCKIDEYAVTYCEDKVYDTDVEYIHKDTFVKKMQDWIKNRAESFIVDTPVFSYFACKRAIEDFKEYMEE